MVSDLRFEFVARTDIGCVRQQNEDCVAISPLCGYAILADGMGGYSAGEVASSMAVEVVKAMLEPELTPQEGGGKGPREAPSRPVNQLLNDAIQTANITVLQAASTEIGHSGMGTTIVAAVLGHDAITIAHVGDSRAYRLRRGEFVQLTRDHSLLQDQIDAGLIHPDQARYAHNKNLVTRAVGVDPKIEVDINAFPIEAGDVYLLCSDGLTDMLTSEEVLSVLSERKSSLQATCNTLVERANENGGYDNVSVVLIREVQEAVDEEPSLFGRIWNWIS